MTTPARTATTATFPDVPTGPGGEADLAAPAGDVAPPGSRRLRTGAPGELLLTHAAPGGGRLTLRVLDPDADLDVLHDWVTRPRARFWGLAELSRAELRDLYAYVGSLPTHHAFLVRWDETPVALLQTYEPEHDPVGEAYPVRPGDVGAHLLLGARGPRGADLWGAVGPLMVAFCFADPRVDRVVVEPDAANARAHARMRALGFETAGRVRVGEKDAVLAFLTRERARDLLAAAAAVSRD
ncbi:GNAT family N-acetyltransferase [Cellulosimicrobium cellulans]|uniref:GNAT family N-acetyltransferase n=1 Tax=Cellulosimicrobium cellulans TaxID=1710 RepID=UPI002097C973|nr:GNAT family N-acetyltransferase [Cellulosimicrobium cellulans]MCO7271820.1 acetyltransferase [Cellulosimicrobium cellulans]